MNTERISNVSDLLKQNPESDASRVLSFLESKGYRMSESIRYQRFVRLVDDAKRNELILVYVEDDVSSAQNKDGIEFSRRALKGFSVLK